MTRRSFREYDKHTIRGGRISCSWRRGVDAFRVLTRRAARRSRLGSALPAHVQHMRGIRGVLITTFPLAACLAETLRVNMALLAQTRLALGGQDDQKSRIFQYFMSPQFHERLATIAEQFQQMQADLCAKKRQSTGPGQNAKSKSKRLFRARRNSPENYRRCMALPFPSCQSFKCQTKHSKHDNSKCCYCFRQIDERIHGLANWCSDPHLIKRLIAQITHSGRAFRRLCGRPPTKSVTRAHRGGPSGSRRVWREVDRGEV